MGVELGKSQNRVDFQQTKNRWAMMSDFAETIKNVAVREMSPVFM
jgi:hypothetical protein